MGDEGQKPFPQPLSGGPADPTMAVEINEMNLSLAIGNPGYLTLFLAVISALILESSVHP